MKGWHIAVLVGLGLASGGSSKPKAGGGGRGRRPPLKRPKPTPGPKPPPERASVEIPSRRIDPSKAVDAWGDGAAQAGDNAVDYLRSAWEFGTWVEINTGAMLDALRATEPKEPADELALASASGRLESGASAMTQLSDAIDAGSVDEALLEKTAAGLMDLIRAANTVAARLSTAQRAWAFGSVLPAGVNAEGFAGEVLPIGWIMDDVVKTSRATVRAVVESVANTASGWETPW